ncbi:MAG: DUF4091 domain-containing protein [Planctomycetes bacterium]|nr:DUF4091 domain-containing protein [Planctomycetota bacterium]
MNHRMALLFGWIAFGILMASAASADLKVWTLTRTEHVRRDAAPGTQVAVKIAAAKNEWESFQILVRCDEPVGGLTIVPGDLNGPDSVKIPAKDARLFRQHQLELTVPTARNKTFKPGWYPDALIPFRHPVTREPLGAARFQAVPFDLPANQTHGFWVDIYVPTNAPAGKYQGTYVLRAGGKGVEIPVTLTVWDFDLPRIVTIKTAFGWPPDRMRSYYRQRAKAGKEEEPKDWDAIESQVCEMLTRHHINCSPPRGIMVPQKQEDGSFRIPSENIAKFREFCDRYQVNALLTPHPRSVVKDPEAERDTLHAWLKAWDEAAKELNRPNVLFYTYLKDEPNDEAAYKYVQKWGRAICSQKSALKVLVVEQTWTQKKEWGDLYGAIDIWCPLFSLFKPESAAKRQALGETIWTYTALCQREPTPWWHIDYPLLNYRVPAWIAWRYGIKGILYWGGLSYWKGVDDPWTDPKTLDRRGKDGAGPNYNGEGSLVYPARAVGYEGIVPSLRLKALRDSFEDYEYLSILERTGLADQARKVVMPLAGSWFKWETAPGAYEKARATLAEMIVNAKK